jgi:hypothetical protein
MSASASMAFLAFYRLGEEAAQLPGGNDAVDRADPPGPLDAVDPVELAGHLGLLLGLDPAAVDQQPVPVGPDLVHLEGVRRAAEEQVDPVAEGHVGLRPASSRGGKETSPLGPAMTVAGVDGGGDERAAGCPGGRWQSSRISRSSQVVSNRPAITSGCSRSQAGRDDIRGRRDPPANG